MEFSGLSTAAARAYVAAHGYNELPHTHESWALKLLRRSATPISAMLLMAAGLSFWSGKDFDGFFILILLLVNVVVTVWQEHKADDAVEKLNAHLATETKVLRDGVWSLVPSRELAAGDVIELKSGALVPADAQVLTANAASVNEAALTGESLPKDKRLGDPLYSGSFVASGLMAAKVSATGSRTRFGKALGAVDTHARRSALERQIIRISELLSGLSLVAVVALTWLLIARHSPLSEVLRLDLSLLIAGIPISLPTVMTLIIAFGTLSLAKSGAIVRRLSSLQELADADFLLTDKTGTLTKNRITVNEVAAFGGVNEAEALGAAALVAAQDPDTAMNTAILERAGKPGAGTTVAYIPGDSDRKHSTLTVRSGAREYTLALGAPQVIASLCTLSKEDRQAFDAHVDRLASRGYRALALARAQGRREEGMFLMALFSLSDELREDAGEVVAFLRENGVGVAMVTGDNRAIAREVAGKLALPGAVLTPADTPPGGWEFLPRETLEGAAAFAEVLPEDKLALIRSAKRFHVVASNGDGINDLPALKEANIGFAVRDAVDALRAAADIVLVEDGIGVMRGAFIEGRRIFARLWAYSVYRISESFRLIATIAILGFLAGTYPLSPLQLILIALLNDIPVISLAGNRVRVANRPSKLKVVEQFSLSLLFGFVGIVNSLLLYFFALEYLHLPLPVVQTLFFLKLTVSGHLLLYVAHTKERWWRYLPSGTVITATMLTQLAATALALSGFLMPAPVSWPLVLFVWGWSFVFMQVSEGVKLLYPTK